MISFLYSVIFSRIFLSILLLCGLAGIVFLDYTFSSLLHKSFTPSFSDSLEDTDIPNASSSPLSPLASASVSPSSFPSPSVSPTLVPPPLEPPISLPPSPLVPLPQISSAVSLKDMLAEQLKKEVIVSESESEAFLFGKIPLTLEDPFLRSLSTEYFTRDAQGIERVLKIYTFNGNNPDEVYTHLLQKSQTFLKNDIESHIVELKTWEKKSFVIKLESKQQFMYLVVALDNSVVGITYPLGINFSSHSQISPLLQRFFRSSGV